MSKHDRCPCGGIILADTENWRTPLCHECWLPLTRMDVQALIDENSCLKDDNAKLYADLIGQEHRLGTKYETEILKLHALLAEARDFVSGACGAGLYGTEELLKRIDAALEEKE